MRAARRVCTLIVAMFIGTGAEAAVRVIRVVGDASYAVGKSNCVSDNFVVAQPRPKIVDDPNEHGAWSSLTLRSPVQVGGFISVSTNSFVDLEFVESGSLLRLAATTYLSIAGDGHPPTFAADKSEIGEVKTNGLGMLYVVTVPQRSIVTGVDSNAWGIELKLKRGRLTGISKFKSVESGIIIETEDSHCYVHGGDDVDFDVYADPAIGARNLSGITQPGFATGIEKCWAVYQIHPRNSRYFKLYHREPLPQRDAKEIERVIAELREPVTPK